MTHKNIRFGRIILVISSAIYTLPFFLSLALPFAYWDWLLTPYYQLRGQAHLWSQLPANILFAFLYDPIQFRPVTAILTNLQYLILGGEFWIWYIIKWIVFAASIYLIFTLVRIFTRSKWAAFVAGIYFALHPMPFVLDVISQDAYVVLFAAASLCWIGSRTSLPDFRTLLTTTTNRDFSVFLGLAAAAVFSKEIGISYLAALLAFFVVTGDIDANARPLSRYGFLVALMGFALFRITHVHHPTAHIDQLISGNVTAFLSGLVEPGQRTCGFLLPTSPKSLLLYAAGSIILCGGVVALTRRRDLMPLLTFAVIGLLGSVFIIASAYPCPKYMPVPVMFFAILLGGTTAALESLFTRSAHVLATGFAILMVLSSPAKIYSQWQGMMQSLYEMSDIINFMERKAQEGYALRGTGGGIIGSPSEMPWEKIATFQEFFRVSSARWYGYGAPIPFSTLQESGTPPDRRFVLLTSLSPAQIDSGALASVGVPNLSGLSGVFVFERDRYGTFEAVTGLLKKMDRTLGEDLRDPIDCQPPQPSRFAYDMPNPIHDIIYFPLHAGPHFLYVFDPMHPMLATSGEIKPTLLAPLRRYGAFAR